MEEEKDLTTSLIDKPWRYHYQRQRNVNTSLFLKGWWVFLMVNLSSKATRTTQIKMHQNPELAMLQSNTNKNKEQNMWTILMRVGGFRTKRKATEFYEYWNKKSRGLCSRIAKGISLVKKYHYTENIKMWTTSRSRDEMISFYNHNRLWLETSSSSSSLSSFASINTFSSSSSSSSNEENDDDYGSLLYERGKNRHEKSSRTLTTKRYSSCYCNRIQK